MRINPNMNYSGLFNSLPKSNNGTQGLASLASEYKNISRGSYRTLANAYVKKMKAEAGETTKKPDESDNKENDTAKTETTKLDPKKMTSKERLQAAKDVADKAYKEKFKQTYGNDAGLSGQSGYSSLFNFEA